MFLSTVFQFILEVWKGEHERLFAMKRPKLGALTARSLLLYYVYVLRRDRVLKSVWNRVGV